MEGLTIMLNAESVHQLVIHPYNAKQPPLQHLHDGIPPLDGQTLPDHRQKIEFFSDLRGMKPAFTATCWQVSCLRSQNKSQFSADGQAMFGHQVGVCHHVGAAIVVVWHCMGV